MKKIFCILSTVMLMSSAYAWEAPDTAWTRTYPTTYFEMFAAMAKTTEGGVVLCGYTSVQNTIQADWLLMRIDPSGSLVWRETLNWGNADCATDIIRTTDGSYAIVGYRDIGNTNWRGVLENINENGGFRWGQSYAPGDTRLTHIIQLSNGGFAMTGHRWRYDLDGNRDGILITVNSSGTGDQTSYFGGPLNDGMNAIAEISPNYLLLLGYYGMTSDSTAGVVVKSNLHGDQQWTHFDFRTKLYYNKIKHTPDGGFIVTGNITLTGHGADIYLMKLDSLGTKQWERTYGGEDDEYGVDLEVTSDGGYIISGYQSTTEDSDLLLLRTDINGDSLWCRTFGTSRMESGSSVVIMNDKSYLVGGTQIREDGNGVVYMVRTNPDLGLWVRHPNGGESYLLFSQDTVRWNNLGYSDSVRIQLNRTYPTGPWETIVDRTPNDGGEVITFSGPPAMHCRIRVTALNDMSVSDESDADFTITSSSGFLGLVAVADPNQVISQWNPGAIECPESQSIACHLKNIGNQAIDVYTSRLAVGNVFMTNSTCGLHLSLQPNEISACTITLQFGPQDQGAYRDTLLIQTNAINAVRDSLRIPLSGTQLRTPSTPQVVIQVQGSNARLVWRRIAVSSGGCTVAIPDYLIFYSPTSQGPFYYHGYTADTTYTHWGVIQNASGMFYNVLATTVPQTVLETLPTADPDFSLTEDHVMELLNRSSATVDQDNN